MEHICFVAQPFDGGQFDMRYRDIIEPAINQCGLKPYRVDEDDSAIITIESIMQRIKDAKIVIAEITLDNPNVWFELGYAIALSKPVVLMCSDERKTQFPFDIRHMNILTYKTRSSSDFIACRNKLESYIRARCGMPTARIINDRLTDEELIVLRYVDESQMVNNEITSEGKIRQNMAKPETVQGCLKSLVRKGYLEYQFSITDSGREGFYHVTEKATQLMLCK